MMFAYHEEREPEWDKLSTEIRQVSMEQWNMSGQLLFWGVLNRRWRPFMDRYLKNTRKKSSIRLSMVCNKIWKVTDNMWALRNEQEHNDQRSEINKKRNDSNNNLIDELFGKIPPKRLLPMSDRYFFNTKPERIKKRKLKDKINWVRRAKIIISKYNEVGNSSVEARNLRTYLMGNK